MRSASSEAAGPVSTGRARRTGARGSRRAGCAALALLALAVPACGGRDLLFVQDDRLTVLAPENRASAELPVSVRWRIDDFRVVSPGSAPASPDAGFFGVFVDRAPIPPGETLEELAADDPECVRIRSCPDSEYFAIRGAYTTTDTSFTLDSIPRIGTDHGSDVHTVTIVLLDSEGRRIGESAWYAEFTLPNEDGR
ncbi:hypothetical protein [Phytoactinopolyspora halotolerans]|uniref:Uncharacterized protein n=1 Tax=Phytoactinopolyspora halotolerans TaxID=1981512 RepID=A0A6L9SG81_9ACTN|nr:hypothetical protein [Phytoactinopolyspora halotolerans]NEE04365.1 hypothetical protein [Phytoactinopolyspora halotolerans]